MRVQRPLDGGGKQLALNDDGNGTGKVSPWEWKCNRMAMGLGLLLDGGQNVTANEWRWERDCHWIVPNREMVT